MALGGMSLFLERTAEQKAQARALLADLQDPSSPRYHQWLKPADYAAQFGASAADLARATAWLEGEGFTVRGASSTGTRLLFSGTVGQVERAFRTEMHRYDVNGTKHFALAATPSIPTDLAPLVAGLHGVHDFKLQNHYRARPLPAFLSDAGVTSGETLALAPADFRRIYSVDPVYRAGITGAGQRIAIVGESDYNDADIAAFRRGFGMDPRRLPERHVVPNSGSPYVIAGGAFGEAELDLEWSGGIAPDADIHYVFTGNDPAYGVFDAILYAIEEGIAPVISSSWGGCEYGMDPSDLAFFEAMGDAAATQGITLLSAQGDTGAADCDYYPETAANYGLSVDWPGSMPNVVAVGGTEFDWGDPIPEQAITPAVAEAEPFSTYWGCNPSTSSCAAKGYVPETGWNEMPWELANQGYFWGSSGGGMSQVFPKPEWQLAQTPRGNFRQVPDIALNAAWSQVGYMVTGSWTAADGDAQAPEPEALSVTGGTSAAAPSFAGILALVNQAIAERHPGAPVGLGNANPVLYALSASTTGTARPAFHDITTGSNLVPCAPGSQDCAAPSYTLGYTAGPGYDMVTGLGSLDVSNLVEAWSALDPSSTTLTVSSATSAEGVPVEVSATVTSADAEPLTGAVLFYAETTDASGVPDTSLVGTGTLTAAGRRFGRQTGTATASLLVPPGDRDRAKIIAFYTGDAHALASWSRRARVTSAPSTLAVSPPSAAMSPGGFAVFDVTGGVAPVGWKIVRDTTCGPQGCGYIYEASPTEGWFFGGSVPGETVVAAVDADGAEVRVTITVANPEDAGAP